MHRVISYINGSSIYLSSIHPFAYDTQEIQKTNINVIVSLMEELDKPDFIRIVVPSQVKHYYYSARDDSGQTLTQLYDAVFSVIFNSLERERNVLIHCRNGESLCVALMVSFMLQCVRWAEKYLIYDFLNYIPKTAPTWTDSFLYYLSLMYPYVNVRYEFRTQLYEYERKILNRTD